MITRRAVVAGLAAIGATSRMAFAQTYPSRSVSIVVPYPPGGPTDALARMIAQQLTIELGHNVLVENKSGGSGAIGTRAVAQSQPDGHTLVLGNNQTHATNASLVRDLGYDPIKDFTPIAGLADLQHVLVVRKDLGISDAAGLVALAKKESGKLNYGSTGIGSGSHLAMELFKTRTGVNLVHVPFRGAAPLAQEVVAGRIDAAFATLPSVLGQIEADTMTGIAVASLMRAPQLPNIPLLREQGIMDAEADSWLALFAPAATPKPITDRLSGLVLAALGKPSVSDAATKLGIAVNIRAPAEFAVYHAAEVKKWVEVIRMANVKVDGG